MKEAEFKRASEIKEKIRLIDLLSEEISKPIIRGSLSNDSLGILEESLGALRNNLDVDFQRIGVTSQLRRGKPEMIDLGK